jgi:hypothetical protein
VVWILGKPRQNADDDDDDAIGGGDDDDDDDGVRISPWVTLGVAVEQTEGELALVNSIGLHHVRVGVSLTGAAQHLRVRPGTVVALVDPLVVREKGRVPVAFRLRVARAQSVHVVGVCPDFALCPVTTAVPADKKAIVAPAKKSAAAVPKKKGDCCGLPCSKRAAMCALHQQLQYNAVRSSRMEFNSAGSHVPTILP